MKKILLSSLVILLFASQAFSQQYVSVGMGYGYSYLKSDGLKQFKNSYNYVYTTLNPILVDRMEGLNNALGIRGEVGYYRFDKMVTSVLVGLQNYTVDDRGTFIGGDSRTLELNIKNLFVELGAGSSFKKFFITGLACIFINRQVILKSSYSTPVDTIKALDGSFKGDSFYSADLGLNIGYMKEPAILSLKITYPIYTRGKSSVLKDKSPDKVKKDVSIFPNDYMTFLYGDRSKYKGVSSNIDGLKVILTFAVVFRIKK